MPRRRWSASPVRCPCSGTRALRRRRAAASLWTANRATARSRLRAGSAALRGADLAYKKIDSLLRGRTVDEIAACLASGDFASAVIAPAFPAQQRITQGGRQYWRPTATAAWQPVEVDLLAELRRPGLPSAMRRPPTGSPGGAFSCAMPRPRTISTPSSRAGRALPAPLLWIGTAGLARALAGPAAPAPRPGARAAAADGDRQPPPGDARAGRCSSRRSARRGDPDASRWTASIAAAVEGVAGRSPGKGAPR